MKSTPKITDSNKYNQQQMTRVVIYFTRMIPFRVALEYTWACYEMFYPWFKYREHAESAFEELITTSIKENIPLGQTVAVTIGIIDSFKERRNLE